MNGPLSQLENFMHLLHEVQRVNRVSRRPDETKYTNTAEHTFEVAMLSWYIARVEQLDFDLEKILRYALAHDIIEAYAGDTYIGDTEGLKDKHEREQAALKRIRKEFKEFPELVTTIEDYEAKASPESQFVYAVDKIVDPLTASMETTQSIWKDLNMSYETLRTYKDEKIARSSVITKYWQAITKKLENKKEFFFD